MKRLVGFDLNGWNDFAARNWLEMPGQESIENKEQVVRGGIGGVVVRVDEGRFRENLVGGLQALRAPHGLGAGWGYIGESDRRKSVRDILRDVENHKSELSSALASMATAKRATTVLAIPDLPETSEDFQEDLLECLGRLRPGNKWLVWRPVLAVLAALLDEAYSAFRENQTIGVIGHHEMGFTAQILTLKQGKLLAPERRQFGQLFQSELGLSPLLKCATELLTAGCAETPRADHVEASSLPLRLALGYECPPQPVRKWNGDWELVGSARTSEPKGQYIAPELFSMLANCDRVLFETPTIGSVSEVVLTVLRKGFSQPVEVLAPDAISRGALEAARRFSRKEPVYFDFLPQISTIVQDRDGAKNYDLIPEDAVLPAGTTYQSVRPAQFGLLAGTEEIKVYLKKEMTAVPRLAVMALPSPPTTNTSVELHVQQQPAAGRARLTLLSDAFVGPLVVDWEAANDCDQDWEPLIQSMEPSLPTIPNRLVLEADLAHWFGDEYREGLTAILENELHQSVINWAVLRGKVAQKIQGRHAISSDGVYPDTLPAESRILLKKAISLAEADVSQRLEGAGTQNNHSLNFLTWLFHRCPNWIVPHLLEGMQAQTGHHPFVQTGGARALMLQGVGRTARDTEHQRRAFDYLLRLPVEKWKKDQLACAAFLLSRNDNATRLLSTANIKKLARIAEANTRDAIGNDFNSRYIYGPYLIVGLIRCRLNNPWALVVGKDPEAGRLFDATEALLSYLRPKSIGNRRIEQACTVLEQVCEELMGRGNNPDILVDLERLS